MRPQTHGDKFYTRYQIESWITTHNPAQIELDDWQYAHLAALIGKNIRDYRGIPIVFVDAPKA